MKTIIITLSIILISLTASADNTILIKVGQSAILKDTTFSSDRTILMYCGKPSRDYFSIKSDNWTHSVNLYYPATAKEITYRGMPIKIIEVDQDYLVINIKK